MVAYHHHLGVRALCHEAAAPQQIADALAPGGVSVLLPEAHPASVPVHHHHLADAAEIADGVLQIPDGHRRQARLDGDADGHSLIDGLQPEKAALTAVQDLEDRLVGGLVVYPDGHDPVSAAHLVGVDVQLAQIGGRQVAVVDAHGGCGHDHQISGDQLSGGVGLAGMVEKAEPLLGLTVDMGHAPVAVHGEHGVGGRVHHVLQNIHFPTLPSVKSFVFPIIAENGSSCNAGKNPFQRSAGGEKRQETGRWNSAPAVPKGSRTPRCRFSSAAGRSVPVMRFLLSRAGEVPGDQPSMEMNFFSGSFGVASFLGTCRVSTPCSSLALISSSVISSPT